MHFSRDFTNIFNWILDNLIPPFIRDSKIFCYPLFWILFRKRAKLFMDFKNNISTLSNEHIIKYYKTLSDAHIKRETDLNKGSIRFILNNIVGYSVLDIACGRGFLAKKIAEKHNLNVTGMDFIINDNLKKSLNPTFLEASIDKIPFPNKHFDTVICAHTLEHVKNIQQGLTELRRVCNRQLIIILPKQRAYQYAFDLHIHFFTYKFSVLNLLNNESGVCLRIDNDWVYYEKK